MLLKTRALPRSEEFQRKKRNQRIIKIVAAVLLVLAVIALLAFISHRAKIRITKVELNGGVLVSKEDVEREVYSYLNGSYFFLFPKNNAFLYPKDKLQDDLALAFRRIDSINLHLSNFNDLVVNINERKPYAIWCKDRDAEDKDCYFMDQNATIFAPAPYFSGDAYFKYYGLLSSSTPIGSQYIASTTVFEKVKSFIDATKQMSLKPVYLVANSQDDFYLVLAGEGKIYFNDKGSIDDTTKNLEALLRTKDLSTSTTAGILPIDYIDLRFGNKLFYKLKQ